MGTKRVKYIEDIVVDIKMKENIFEYKEHLNINDSVKMKAYNNILCHVLKDCDFDTLNWTTYINCLRKKIDIKTGTSHTCVLTSFIFYLIDNNSYPGDDKEYFIQKRSLLENYFKGGAKDIDSKLSGDIQPYGVIKMEQNDNTRVFLFADITKDIAILIDEYFNVPHAIYNTRKKDDYDSIFFTKFTKSLDNIYIVNTIDDLNDNTFIQQFNYFSELGWSSKKLGFVLKFYIYVQYRISNDVVNKRFPLYDINTLKYNTITSKLQEGYKIVKYSIYDEPKFYPRILLKENNMDLNSSRANDTLTMFDFTVVTNKYFQKLCFEFLWQDVNHSLMCRRDVFYPLKEFLVFLSDTKNNDNSHKSIEITIDNISEYKNLIINHGFKDGNILRRCGAVKQFLNFLDRRNIYHPDALCFTLLTHKDDDGESYTESFSQQEIFLLLDSFKDRYEKETVSELNCLYELYYYALSIFSISEIRLSSILALSIDSLKTTLNKKGQEEYKLLVHAKSSGTEPEEYNITKYVKNLFCEVINKTIKFRDDCPENIKKSLFICQNRYRGGISRLRDNSFREYYDRICDDYKVRRLKLGAVRNYYMQNVSKFVNSNGYDSMLIEKLSKHSSAIHNKHYDDVDIKDFCQRFYDVEIGSVYLKGKIENENTYPVAQTVGNGCGHCSLERCSLIGKLDCFMCEHFVTTLESIPYFEQEIEKIDKLIYEQKIQHEKEFLNSKKKLFVAYLEKLLELEVQINGNKQICNRL